MTDPRSDIEIAITAWEWPPLVGARPRRTRRPAADEPGLICATSLQFNGTVTSPQAARGDRVHVWLTGMPAEFTVSDGSEYRGLGDIGWAASDVDANLMLRLPENLFNAAVCGAHKWRRLRLVTEERDDVLWVIGYAFSEELTGAPDA